MTVKELMEFLERCEGEDEVVIVNGNNILMNGKDIQNILRVEDIINENMGEGTVYLF